MKTVKQVSELTGISVRALHYYDQIGLLKPSENSVAGYRYYDESALETLQQILFFKELEFPLKEIKEIMTDQHFNKIQAYENHKRLLVLKRDRLNDLIELVDKTMKGVEPLSFKEFSMKEYFNTLEEFKGEHSDEVAKYWGSIDKFNEFIEKGKQNEKQIAEMAIKQYGSIEKYTQAMKNNLEHFSEKMECLNEIKDNLEYYKNKQSEIMTKLTADLTKEVSSEEIQQIIEEMVSSVNETMKNFDMGNNYWELVMEGYRSQTAIIEVTDKMYGIGASSYIAEALEYYCKNLKL